MTKRLDAPVFLDAYVGPVAILFRPSGRGIVCAAITGRYIVDNGFDPDAEKQVYKLELPWSRVETWATEHHWELSGKQNIFFADLPVPTEEDIPSFQRILNNCEKVFLLTTYVPINMSQKILEWANKGRLRFGILSRSACFLETDNTGAYLLSRLASSIDEQAVYLMRGDDLVLYDKWKEAFNVDIPGFVRGNDNRNIVVNFFTRLTHEDPEVARGQLFRFLAHFKRAGKF